MKLFLYYWLFAFTITTIDFYRSFKKGDMSEMILRAIETVQYFDPPFRVLIYLVAIIGNAIASIFLFPFWIYLNYMKIVLYFKQKKGKQ